jgi:hypothetical protein
MIGLVHWFWLGGLAALSVPLLLHLLRRRDAPPEVFPPAVLLERGAVRRLSRLRLAGLLQLALRLSLLAAIVLAFARVLLPGGGKLRRRAPAGLLMLVDDSPSMSRKWLPPLSEPSLGSRAGVSRGEVTRLHRALQEARAAVGELGDGSEAALVFSSGRSLGPMLPAEMAGGLEAMLRGSPGTRAGARQERALAAIPAFLDAMSPLDPAVLLLGDRDPEEAMRSVRALVGRSVRVAAVDLGAGGCGDDWAVAGARIDRRRLVAGEDARMLVRVARAPGEAGPDRRRLELVMDGLAVAWRDVRLAPGAESEVALGFSLGAGAHRGRVRLTGSDAWELNDSVPVALVVQPAARLAVICARERLSGDGRAVVLALSAGPGEERKAFLAESMDPDSARAVVLGDFAGFVLVGPPVLERPLASRLARRVAAGAGAVILADDPAALGSLAVPLGLPLPAAGDSRLRLAGGARLVPAVEGRQMFSAFRPALAGRVFRRGLQLKADGLKVLARMKSEDRELPGLVEHRPGRGCLLVLASSPARRFSRLAEREWAGLFVPLMHEMAARACGLLPAESVALAGEDLRLAASPRERAARFWLEGGPGLRFALGSPGRDLNLHVTAPSIPGNYTVASELDGATLSTRAMSVRHDPAEMTGFRTGGARRSRSRGGPEDAAKEVAGMSRAPARENEITAWIAGLGLLLLLAEAAASFAATGGPEHERGQLPVRSRRGRAGG